jgi:hypothetical protein
MESNLPLVADWVHWYIIVAELAVGGSLQRQTARDELNHQALFFFQTGPPKNSKPRGVALLSRP